MWLTARHEYLRSSWDENLTDQTVGDRCATLAINGAHETSHGGAAGLVTYEVAPLLESIW